MIYNDKQYVCSIDLIKYHCLAEIKDCYKKTLLKLANTVLL